MLRDKIKKQTQLKTNSKQNKQQLKNKNEI